ncbi:MAG: hypothetical protein MJ252_21845 [archaeon]|nr:hypothetical protein [archaeon]
MSEYFSKTTTSKFSPNETLRSIYKKKINSVKKQIIKKEQEAMLERIYKPGLFRRDYQLFLSNDLTKSLYCTPFYPHPNFHLPNIKVKFNSSAEDITQGAYDKKGDSYLFKKDNEISKNAPLNYIKMKRKKNRSEEYIAVSNKDYKNQKYLEENKPFRVHNMYTQNLIRLKQRRLFDRQQFMNMNKPYLKNRSKSTKNFFKCKITNDKF